AIVASALYADAAVAAGLPQNGQSAPKPKTGPATSAPRTASLAGARSAEFDRLVKAATDARQAQRWEEAVELYGKAAKLKPDYVEGYWYQGTAYYSLDDHSHCRDAFRRVVRLAPKN